MRQQNRTISHSCHHLHLPKHFANNLLFFTWPLSWARVRLESLLAYEICDEILNHFIQLYFTWTRLFKKLWSVLSNPEVFHELKRSSNQTQLQFIRYINTCVKVMIKWRFQSWWVGLCLYIRNARIQFTKILTRYAVWEVPVIISRLFCLLCNGIIAFVFNVRF